MHTKQTNRKISICAYFLLTYGVIQMDIRTIEANDSFIHLALGGRLDIDGVQHVEMDFSRSCSAKLSVIVDMSEVSFLASLGLRMLLSAAKRLNADGNKLILHSMQPMVMNVIKAAGLQHVIPSCDDFSAAREILNQ